MDNEEDLCKYVGVLGTLSIWMDVSPVRYTLLHHSTIREVEDFDDTVHS